MRNTSNINPNRKKILEAIVYFSKMLKYPSKTMIYKVLAELDYRHFQETGLPVTNLEYKAWKRGPVPTVFHDEITDRESDSIDLPKDFEKSLYVEKKEWVTEDGSERKMFLFKNKRNADLEVFSPRQKRILEEVATIYKDATPRQASEASHERNTPWFKTNAKKGKEGERIDFFEILPSDSKIDVEEARERYNELAAFIQNYKASG